MIFRVSNKPFFEDNPGALAIFPEKTPDKLMKYYVLFHDPDSPFRRIYTDNTDRKKAVCGSKFIGWTLNTYKQYRDRYKYWWDPQEKKMIGLIKDKDIEIRALEAMNVEIDRQLELIGKKSKTTSEKEEVAKILPKLESVMEHRNKLQERYDEKYGYMIEVEISDDSESHTQKSALEKYLG